MEGHKMKRVLLLLFLPFLGVCSPFPVPRPPKAFLPGECLVSEELKFRGEFNKVHIRLNLANYEEIEDVFFPNDSWLWPTAGARLGIKNVERVEGEYKKRCLNSANSWVHLRPFSPWMENLSWRTSHLWDMNPVKTCWMYCVVPRIIKILFGWRLKMLWISMAV